MLRDPQGGPGLELVRTSTICTKCNLIDCKLQLFLAKPSHGFSLVLSRPLRLSNVSLRWLETSGNRSSLGGPSQSLVVGAGKRLSTQNIPVTTQIRQFSDKQPWSDTLLVLPLQVGWYKEGLRQFLQRARRVKHTSVSYLPCAP